ncbi:hypothetical protein [Bdellovibrio sp. NC01]|uniref:hypothetical protein n=1 Tax=Bdellovibrio sp. NC01 TaxID=2220073 RepID=UPI00115BE8E2|nr:hypothetical protein [Bdellovibrio sp. NC01]QDK38707.1 hypothetical protein DOE51_14490 [Bdellovibrio sp. NC01]
MNSKNTLLVSSICASLMGCLDSAKESSTEAASKQATSSQLTTVEAANVSSESCSNGKEGSVAYDASQNQFFVCKEGEWSLVDLRGPKGDKGDTGSQGVVGLTGASGINGINGRDGVDGEGQRLSLRDGARLIGVLVQYQRFSSDSAALIALPNGQYVFYNVKTGKPTGSSSTVVYTGPNCTGDAFTGRGDEADPYFVGRVFASQTEDPGLMRYYQVVGYPVGTEIYQSSRDFGTLGTRGKCIDKQPSATGIVKVVEVSAPESVRHLAPLQFTF